MPVRWYSCSVEQKQIYAADKHWMCCMKRQKTFTSATGFVILMTFIFICEFQTINIICNNRIILFQAPVTLWYTIYTYSFYTFYSYMECSICIRGIKNYINIK